MGKITGKEKREELPEKVLLLYQAVQKLIEEEADLSSMTVSDITKEAGIGKGTAYEYFEKKEDIILYAVLFNMEQMLREFRASLMVKGTFEERIRYTLEAVGQEVKAQKCILKYVNLLYDSTQIGKLLRDRLESTDFEEYPVLRLGMELVKQGIEAGELREDLPVSYMVYVLIGKIVAYMAYLVKQKEAEISDEQFRQYILNGIMAEFKKTAKES